MEENSIKEKIGILEILVCIVMPILLVFVDYGVGKVFNFNPLRILLIFSGIIFLIKYFRKEIQFKPTVLFIPFLILLMADAFSFVNAVSKFSVIRGLLIQTALIIIYYFVIHAVHAKNLFNKTINILAVTTLITSISAYIQKFTGLYVLLPFQRFLNVYSIRTGIRTAPAEFTFLRPSSFFIDTNTLAFFLILFLPLFLGLFLYHITSETNSKMKYIYAIVIILEIPILVMTLSRNNWIAGFIGILVFSIIERKILIKNVQFWKFAIIIILVTAVFCSIPQIKDSIHYRLKEISKMTTQERSGSDASRLKASMAGWEAFKRYPIFGIGIGAINFTKFYQQNYDSGVKEWDPHCWPIKVLAETGIMGGIANFLWVFIFIRHVLTTKKKLELMQSDKEKQYWHFFVSGAISGIVVLLITSLFGQSFTAEFSYFFIGLVMAGTYIIEKNATFHSNC